MVAELRGSNQKLHQGKWQQVNINGPQHQPELSPIECLPVCVPPLSYDIDIVTQGQITILIFLFSYFELSRFLAFEERGSEKSSHLPKSPLRVAPSLAGSQTQTLGFYPLFCLPGPSRSLPVLAPWSQITLPSCPLPDSL